MSPQDQIFRNTVKKRLIDRGLTVTALARKIGLARNTVNIAINHPSMFKPTKAAIRRELNL